jgi:CBS domain-containing protein
MLRRVAVGDVMTRNFSATSPHANLLDCTKQMVKQRVGCLLLTEGKKLKGLLTQKDILWVISKKPLINLTTVKASDVATKKIAVIKPSATIAEAFEKMREYGFRRLPVITKGEVVGLLTIKDILAVDPSFYNLSGDLFALREQHDKLKRVMSEEREFEGLCDQCGSLSDLVKVGSRHLCPDCRAEL